jgi:putative transposase
MNKPPDPWRVNPVNFPPWLDHGDFIRINKCMPYPSNQDIKGNTLEYKFNTHHHVDKKGKDKHFFNCDHYAFANPVDFSSFEFETFESIDYKKKKQNIINKFEEYKTKIIDHDNYDTKVKTQETKINNQIYRLNKILKMKKIMLYITADQKQILMSWINESRKVYNTCVDMFNANSKTFDLNYKISKLLVFQKMYGNNPKPAPYDTLTDEVRAFCSNVKGNFTAIKNKTKTHFTMTHKSPTKIYSLLIPKTAIKTSGIYPSILGEQFNFSNIVDINEVQGDCRLIYDSIIDGFYLTYPFYDTIKEKNIDPKRTCAIDENEQNFLAYYSLYGYGIIGSDIRIKILNRQNRISKLQMVLSRNKNKKGKKIKRPENIIKEINMCYRRIKNLVKELHNQIAIFLCKNFDVILLPKFGTRQMISDKAKQKKAVKETRNNIKDERDENGFLLEEKTVKKNLRTYQKRVRLNKRVKYVLGQLSHYKFKQHLERKCIEYGCKIIEVTEEFTTQLCTKCWTCSKKCVGRIKECTKCHKKIHRDVNGARNTYLKNFRQICKFLVRKINHTKESLGVSA